MSVWHGSMHKKKSSGGRRRTHRKKRRYEHGGFPAETSLGERKWKSVRGRGGSLRVKILSEKRICVADIKKGKTQKTEILRVVRNPVSVDYDRRRVITRGAIVETPIGLAKVTSRPGQHGTLSAILTSED